MKAILEFNLPEDTEEYKLAQEGAACNAALFEFDQWLRGEIKYAEREELQEVRDKLYEFIRDAGIDLI